MIKLNGVSKYYKTQTGVSEGMRNINLNFKLNEFVAITGESGSGKTTLLNVISGLDSYEDGELYVNGQETSHYTVKEWEDFRAKNVGFVFQNYNVIDSYTVYQNVIIALEAQGYTSSNKKSLALELIDKVGLTSHKNQKTSKLSGGQKQRVVIARALAKNAPIILADEPTGNLDEKSGKEIMELLKEISKDKLIILVTHNFNEAKPYVTRNIVMSDGNIKDDKLVNKNEFELTDQVINNSETEDNIFKVSSKIALRNLTSTPKKSIFTMVLMMVSIALFVLSYSLLIKNQAGLVGPGDGVSITLESRNSEFFSKVHIDDLINKYDSDDISIYVNLPKIMGSISTSSNSPHGFQLGNSGNIKETDLSDGTLPNSNNEVVLSQYFKQYYKVGSQFKASFRGASYTFIELDLKVVGFTKDLNNRQYYDYRVIYFNESYLYDDNYKLNSTIFDVDGVSSLIVVGSDRQEIKLFKGKINNDTYRVMDDFLEYEKELEFISKTLLIFYWVILIIILSVIFLVMYNIFKNVMETRKKDFAVYRSIGISEKEVALTILIEQVILAIVSTVLTIIILQLLGLKVDFFRTMTRHITIFDYLLVSFVFTLFSLLQGLRYNKKIFNITVIESLKEDN